MIISSVQAASAAVRQSHHQPAPPAKAPTPQPEPSASFIGTDARDLTASGMLQLASSQIGFNADVSVFETGADIWTVVMTIRR